MKNRFTAIILICALLLVGCGSEGQSVNDSVSGAEPEVEEAVDSAEESGEGAQALYEKFLNNEVPVTIDSHVDQGSYFTFQNYDGNEYTLEELVNLIIADYIGEDDFIKIWLDKIEYAYIDCGADGEPELALHIDTPASMEDWNEYIVIKEFDGKLKTVYSTVAWSRSYTYINEYGYIYGDGSGGASSHSFDKSFVDGDGKLHFIYADTTELMWISEEENELFGNGMNYEFSAEEVAKYSGEYIQFDFYFDQPDADDYESHIVRSYGKVADEDDILDSESGYRGYCYCELEDDESIYDENSPLWKCLGGENVYTLSEIEKMIADKEAEVGLTEKIKNGAEADWKELEINFEPYIANYNSDNFLEMKAYFPLYFSLSRVDKGTATSFTVDRDGNIEGKYDEYDFDNGVTTINEFTGRFTDVKKLDEYSYSLTMSELELKYTPDTEGYETLSNGYEAYRIYITPYGLEDSSAVHYILYVPGTPVSKLDDRILENMNEYHVESLKEQDVLEEYILFNTEADEYCVWLAD